MIGTMNRKSLWQFLKDVFTQWIEDEPFLLASSLSYYTIFSLAPLLVIAIARCGTRFWPRSSAEPDR
jgi:membrane protein